MRKDFKQKVYNKFNGKCAYTGKPLQSDWQIDHVESKMLNEYLYKQSDVNDIDNLLPALRIANHYKRAFDLEGFRDRMTDFHVRFGKLPKNPKTDKTRKRIAYMNEVADAFDITPEKPFCGKFYFETL